MAQFNRQDFIYESPDGDEWRITLIDSTDRKYIEIQKQGDERIDTWDMSMFLDIADAVSQTIRKPMANKKRKLKGPKITDHRADQDEDREFDGNPASIQNSVDEAMEQGESGVRPVESFSPVSHLKADIEERKKTGTSPPDPKKVVHRSGAGVNPSDLM